MLIDKNALKFVSKNESTMVLMENIPAKMSYYGFLDFIDNLKKRPNISLLHFCFFNGNYSVICKFDDATSMEMFLSSIRK